MKIVARTQNPLSSLEEHTQMLCGKISRGTRLSGDLSGILV